MRKFTAMKAKKSTIIIGAAVFSAIFALLFKWWTTGNPFHSSTVLFGAVIFFILLTSFFIANKYFLPYLDVPVKQLKKRIVPAFLIFMLVILLLSLVIIGIVTYSYYWVMGLDRTGFMNNLLEVELPGAIKYFAVFALLGASIFFYNAWRQAVDKEQQLREENLKYKYRTLKTQVNPHFLFNSLNTLSEMIYEDTAKADHYIQQLAGIYRFILRHEQTDMLPLNEELAFVKQYFDLQQERAGDKIRLDIDVEDGGKYRIIPISLQILVENALKHNSASEENPLVIHISFADESIIVANNIQKKSILNGSSGTGLLNLKERSKLIMNREMIVSQTDNQFIVKLPIIPIAP